MNIRPLDWRDFLTLHRYRHQGVFFDSALLLTRGPMVIPGALMSYLAPTAGVLTYVRNRVSEDGFKLIGQIILHQDSKLSHIIFLAPQKSFSSPGVMELLESLVYVSGEKGANHLIAEVEESSQAYIALRRANFSVYTRQRIWKTTPVKRTESKQSNWCKTTSKDEFAVRSLYNDLVPQMVRQVEPDLAQDPSGMILNRSGELAAYVDLKIGRRGIWVNPLIHPSMDDFSGQFTDLIHQVSNRYSKPIYVCVRSYQSWLGHPLEELGFEAGPQQAVMVKHMAFTQKAEIRNALAALEGGQPEITAPISRSEITQYGTTKNH